MGSQFTRQYDYRAAAILKSADSAAILHRMQWSIDYHAVRPEGYFKEFYHDGKWWMKDTMDLWQRSLPHICERTVKRSIAKFKELGWIEIWRPKKTRWDHTTYYHVNQEKVEKDLKESHAQILSRIKENYEKKNGVKTEGNESDRLRICAMRDSDNLSPSDSDNLSPSDSDNLSPSSTSMNQTISHTLDLSAKPPSEPKTELALVPSVTKPRSASRGEWSKFPKTLKNKAPRDYIPTDTHLKLAIMWEEHLAENSLSKERLARIDYAYQIAFILNRNHVTDLNEQTLSLWIKWLTKCLDAHEKWDGWGKVLTSLPIAIKGSGETGKFVKSWRNFYKWYKNDWEQLKKDYEWEQKQQEKERLGLERDPF